MFQSTIDKQLRSLAVLVSGYGIRAIYLFIH